ncbi:tRNA epoxyqueuosine(34) reductase QueG [Methylocella sp.]|uniref:tRNA epoxyqueuosine(34) reductase QueG n=1 Tax=Methylocella sp. TaxID=1978226 RepID=UPI003785042A
MNAGFRKRLEGKAKALGFDTMRVAPAALAPEAGARLRDWVAAGFHGDMGWMEETAERRADPRALFPEVRSVLMLGLNYGPDEDPRLALDQPGAGAISVYARHRDYHDVVKGRLKELAGFLVAAARRDGLGGADVKVFVDTAPVMEKPLAQAAGLGWQGKHTNLVSRDFGSWLFLGSIFTTLELAPDAPEEDRCGSCRACLDACPTQAFPKPYVLDARRCVSYLTIEHKGHIPAALREKIGARVYGCDDCLAACPWNKFAEAAREAKLQARADLRAPRLDTLLRLDEAAFRALFAGSPVKRIGHARFLRNVLVAAGNSREAALAAPVAAHLESPDAIVRAMAVWALARLRPEFLGERRRLAAREDDADVLREWKAALALIKKDRQT